MHDEKTATPVKSKFRNIVVRTLKFFIIFLFSFAVLMSITIYQLRSFQYFIVELQQKNNKPGSTKPQTHLLNTDAINFSKCAYVIPKNNKGKELNVNDIDGKLQITPEMKAQIIGFNKEITKNILEMAAKEPATAEMSLQKIPGDLDIFVISDFEYSTYVTKCHIASLLCQFALNEKDYITAMKFDLGLIRAARAAAFGSYLGVPTLTGAMIQIAILGFENYRLKKIYLSSDDLFGDTAAVEFMRRALAVRIKSLKVMPGIAMSVMLEAEYGKAFFKFYSNDFPWSIALLELYYGKFEPWAEIFSKDIEGIINEPWRSQIEAVKKKEARYSTVYIEKSEYDENGEKINKNEYFQYLWKNPLQGEIPVISNMFIDAAENDIRYRLTTLGGLARLYYFDHGKWPDILKDKGFKESAGETAVDSIVGAPIRSIVNADGSITFYSVGTNYIDDGGDENKDIIIKVKKPVKN